MILRRNFRDEVMRDFRKEGKKELIGKNRSTIKRGDNGRIVTHGQEMMKAKLEEDLKKSSPYKYGSHVGIKKGEWRVVGPRGKNMAVSQHVEKENRIFVKPIIKKKVQSDTMGQNKCNLNSFAILHDDMAEATEVAQNGNNMAINKGNINLHEHEILNPSQASSSQQEDHQTEEQSKENDMVIERVDKEVTLEDEEIMGNTESHYLPIVSQ